MLNDTTKRKINSLRQILVGKVPDPKSQVEQITNALIYKYMDDMDRQAEVYGGKASFFADEYEKYSWRNLMDPKKGAQERMNLYLEALEKMSTNKNLAPIFRDILKGAFVPYRSPETLNMFLHEIDGFSYDHSEDLGDAFEYLLSIMGSQGDAGQFRTPRHIIDFIVDVVDPQKDETILDPACGTAGFLISAYKHIEENNRDKSGASLAHDARRTLHKNFSGYDISPEMVKLSRVNMFLHNFPEPRIFEYDTLSDDARWSETFDVILANPPFMTPKGGIIPHNRFGIKANRAEVLFVDYILEHLKSKGRAGIIVPEGIIFQSANAYKQLRKALVEDGLFAVISLPSGVFNPYAGVKTSILIFDVQNAKKTDEICFVKIENDGFDLGAQRREISGSNLPQAVDILHAWKRGEKKENKLAHWVKREKIAESGDYNLSGDRYRISEVAVNQKWPMVELGEICEIYQPRTITSKDITKEKRDGWYKVFGANGVIGYYHQYNHEYPEVLITCRGATCGTINLSDHKSWITGNAMVVHPKNSRVVIKGYLYYLLRNMDLSPVISGAAQPQITRQSLNPYKIPLPPLEIQQQIVAEIDGYQKIIDGARQVVENWKPKIDIDPEWAKVKLGEICDLKNGYAFKSSDYINKSNTLNFRMSNIKPGGISDINYNPRFLPDIFAIKYKEFLLKENDLVVAMTDLANDPKILGIPTIIKTGGKNLLLNQRVGKIINKTGTKIYLNYLSLVLMDDRIREYYKTLGGGGLQVNISKRDILSVEISLPSLEIQKQIVEKIEAERALVESSKKLIEIYEQKIKNVITNIWK